MKTHARKHSGGALCNQQPRVYGPLMLATDSTQVTCGKCKRAAEGLRALVSKVVLVSLQSKDVTR